MPTLHIRPDVPRYMKTFRCIGGECPQSCCYGWRIGIEEKTFRRYQKVNVYPLAASLKAALEPAENAGVHVAWLRLREEDGGCQLLRKDNLCEIHAQLGSPYLSDTCMHYPRVFTLLNGKISCHATLSCPAAAELALLDPHAMDMDRMDMSILGRTNVPVEINLDGQTQKELAVEFVEPIHEVVSMILRRPELSAVDAMAVISLMVQKIARHFAEPDPVSMRNGLVQTLTDFCRPAYCVEVRDAIAALPKQTVAKISLLKGITIKFLQERKDHVHSLFAEVVAQAAQGLHFEAPDLAASEQAYLDAEERWFGPFDSAHPHLLKNYLLNDLGKNSFPAGKSLNIETEFINLAVRFSLIRLYLVGIAGTRQHEFNEKDYVRMVYTFVRNLEHSSFFPDTLEVMEEQGYNNLASAVLLLR